MTASVSLGVTKWISYDTTGTAIHANDAYYQSVSVASSTATNYAALDGHGPLLIEEPELSLHPEVVRGILPMLAGIQRRSGRQLFLTTHSADLVEDQRIALGDVLLLVPGEEGTSVRPPAAHRDMRDLLDGALAPSAAGAPADAPAENQLGLFGGE